MRKHNLIVGLATLFLGLALSGCTSINLLLDGTEMPSAEPTAAPVEEAAAEDVMAEEAGEGNGAMGVMGAAVATVSTSSLRLHRFPDEASPVTGGLIEGESYRVIGISSDGTWVRLEVLEANSGSGWVTARFVSVRGDITDVPITDGTGVAAARPTPAPGKAVVSTDGTRLRVRSEPSTESAIVTYVYDGDALPFVGATDDGVWVELDVSGTRGWVAREFVLLEGDEVPAVAEAAAPEAESATEEVAEEPATEEASNSEAGAAEDEAPAVELPEAIPGQAIVITDGTLLRVRAEASSDSEIVGYAENGEAYTILETSEDGLWRKIEIDGIDGDGWVADQFVLTAE